jgi:aldose 1-epimerase
MYKEESKVADEIKAVAEYTLSNASGMRITVINYGAAVTSIVVPDKDGRMGDVVLGFDSPEGYLQPTNPYMGCIAGRYANRIANGKFSLHGIEYQLTVNDNGQCLHGGNKGFDKVIWNAEVNTNGSSVTLSYFSKDAEEGFPGNLLAEIIYQLLENNSLKIDYIATTDKAGPVNLTSHCYFNLSAGKDATILDHQLQINADSFTEVNNFLIPTGNLPQVKNTAMDFTAAKKIGKDIPALKDGYDHNWVINKKENILVLAATLQHLPSGRCMEVYTTHPGIQLYTGNSFDGSLLQTKHHQKYQQYAGLCLETQNFPDAPNQPAFPNSILRPGEKYRHTTIYKFMVKT